MTWTVTYRTGGPPKWAEHSETLDEAWCKGTLTDPASLSSPEHAAWTLALLLGDHGHADAELIRIEEEPGVTAFPITLDRDYPVGDPAVAWACPRCRTMHPVDPDGLLTPHYDPDPPSWPPPAPPPAKPRWRICAGTGKTPDPRWRATVDPAWLTEHYR